MSDVFVSYARSTEQQGQAVAEALKALGYSVWIDDQLPAHRNYSHVIEEELDQAKAVLVVWSAEAAKSDWVMDEAERAREQRKLVQVRLDKTRLPMPFGRIQCADLTGWTGDLETPSWRKVAAGIADLVGAAWSSSPSAPSHPRAVAERLEPLLAVLAFDNLSGDPEMAYFSDGVSEEILQTVARGADLKVIGRASSFQFRGADKAAAKVAGVLRATHVLDGSVRRAGSKVRIAANLIECAHEITLWSDRYDRELTDVFALQDEIATSVAAALKTAFARLPAPWPIDPAAYDLFLQERAFQDFEFETLRRRLKMLEEVVARAPAFARGWATLADLGAITLRTYRDECATVGLTRVQVVGAAETALRLDPHMGRAYQALAWLEPFAAYRDREALMERALAAAPNDAHVLSNVGAFCGTVGRLREGLSFARKAFELDPLQREVTNMLGILLVCAGEIEEATRLYAEALARWPERFNVASIVSNARAGNRAKVESLIRTWSSAARDASSRTVIRFARNLLDPDPTSIAGWLEEQKAELTLTGTVPLLEPWGLHVLGLRDEAFDLLETASFAHMFERDGPQPSGMNYPGEIFDRTNPAFYSDSRFPRLCAKLGLADYWIETRKWPDCADDVPYDFRAEARKASAAERALHV